MLNADVETVWTMLNDQDVLEAAIPGADELVQTSPDHYKVTMNVGIGMIRGAFSGNVEITDKEDSSSYRMLVDGKGPGGWVRGDGRVALAPVSESRTRVAVDGDAQVGGVLARVGQRMMGNASKSLMKQFFSNLDKEISKRTAG